MILIVPASDSAQGGGHLSRCLLLLRSLRLTDRGAYLWIPDNLKDNFLQRFNEFFKTFDHLSILSQKEQLLKYTWDFIVLDCFSCRAKDFAFWSGLAPLVGIDEGGPFRKRFDFLIDLLPSLSKHEANLFSPNLLPLPRDRRPANADSAAFIIRVLVSFGAEDTAGLGAATARALDRLARKSGREKTQNRLDITLVAPIPPTQSFANVKVIGKIPMLKERLCEYDLFITHFGLGAFEAVYARVPVLLISPTAYHEKLSRKAGFFSLGFGSAKAARLESFTFDSEFIEGLQNKNARIARRFDLEKDQEEDLSFFIHSLRPDVKRYCPACGKKFPYSQPVLARSTEESYRRCPFCGTIYLNRLKALAVKYERDYFFDAYKKQYGKTYLEDFPNLKEMGKKRVAVIKALQGRMTENLSPKLLDIGCAYGPFLAASAESGFAPAGIDPAEDAVSYVKEELRFPAWRGFFPDALLNDTLTNGGGFYDVITLWYVIEHFREPGEILREINHLLKNGGVLAFSTPSASGISGRKNLRSFLKANPPDHFTVWSPRACKKLLWQYGFTVKKIVVTGHHPERFPFFGRFLKAGEKSCLYRMVLLVSRIFRLGDTFEVYAIKQKS